MSHHESHAIGADARPVDRMLFFSDAVFAIVLTLLVLELRPPVTRTSDELVAGLVHLIPHFIAFGGTFAVVSFFWAAHLTYTRRLVVFDWRVAWLNLLLLFGVALTPFASAMLGAHPSAPISWKIYAVTLIAISVLQTLVWLSISRGGGRLMGGVEWRERGHRTLRGLSPAVAFSIGYALIDTGHMELVYFSPLLILPVMLLAGLVFGFRHPRTSP